MPKKRYQARFSKPQSTAPASLSISSTAAGTSSSRSSRRNSQHDETSQGRGVNELLADMRRTALSGGGNGLQQPVEIPPTLPPVIRDILQLPETPALRPRRPDRRRLGHSGPPAPRSWLSTADRTASARKRLQQYGGPEDRERHPLPEAYLPAEGSLIDVVLRRFAYDWSFQRSYCRYYLYDLPKHLREALLTYLGIWNPEGVSLADLHAILLPPPNNGDGGENTGSLSPGSANEFFHLNLTGSLGWSLKLREFSRFLYPSRPQSSADLQESWDAPEDTSATVPQPLLPNLTHLSFAIRPDCAQAVSWRHLLSFVVNCPTLTHLSLAFWPEPSLTPNAKLASFVSPQGRTVPYSGTGPYSHSIDNDWSEAIVVLRRLSKTLYGLEYLDLTGCGDWYSALWSTSWQDAVDWVGDWGKMSTLLMYPGYQLADDAGAADTAKYWEIVQNAERVERHITGKRAGRGRFITVETVKRSEF